MCDPILVTPMKVQAHDSQSSRENAVPSGVPHQVAHYQEVPPPHPPSDR